MRQQRVVVESGFSARALCLWMGLCVLAGVACAGDPAADSPNRRPDAAGTGGGSGTGGAADGTAGDFGNGSGGRPSASGGTFSDDTPPPPLPPGERQLVTEDDCGSSGVAADVVTRLTDSAVGAGTGRLLYPYDKTVFPQGLTAPVLQWDAPASGSAVMLHLRSQFLDYRTCLSLGTPPTNIPIPQDAWELASRQSLGAADPLTVDIVIDTGSQSERLTTLTVLFAIAKLKGAIYYNTYGSLLATQMGAVGGVVMRVLPGQPAPEVFLTAADPLNCIGCHAVSADGSRMVAEIHVQPGIVEGPSASYDLSAVGAAVNPPAIRSDLVRAGFAALYPDGSVYVTTGRTQPGPFGALPGQAAGNVPGTFGPEQSKLFDTNSGAEIPNSGIEPYAYMPTFAVDGSKIVFTQMDTSGMGGHALQVMDFDRATNTFTNGREIFRDATQFVGWPFFTPDVVEQRVEGEVTAAPPPPRGKRVVFALGQTPDFVTQDQPLGLNPHPSDLWWVDVDSGTAAPLHRANGLDPNGAPTLPYGERDAHKNYIPTVSPVAAGGYFWMFFTSKRNYGNLFVADPPESRAEGKKIWVAAIDINAAPGTDASHPAFFLPGQELESGNIRAFAALEPCRENASACETGIDCCCGFCIEGACACKPEDRCAEIDEACESAADCCDPNASCIGGFCGYVVVQ